MAIPRIFFPDLDHGDEFSDANVLNAGQNFVKFGFIKCRFLPMFEPQANEPQQLYTHYPPLPDIINGIVRIIFKTDSLYLFRCISLLFAFGGLVFWYLFMKKLSGSNLLGFLCTIFFMANPTFIFVMDSLHESSYSEFLRALILFAFMVYLNSRKNRKTLLFFLWILIVLESLVTFEYMIYLSLFFVLFKMMYKFTKNSISWKEIAVLLSAPVFAFLVHFLQNVWYFGSFSSAYQDLRAIATQRIIDSKDSAIALNFFNWARFAFLQNFSLVFIFDFFVLLLMFFCGRLLFNMINSEVIRKRMVSSVYLGFIFAICGISWYIFFPAHSIAHAQLLFLSRHLLPLASLAFGSLFYIVLTAVRKNYMHNYFIKALAAIIIPITLFISISRSNLPIASDKIKWGRDFPAFKNCLLDLKKTSAENDAVGVNYFRFPFIRYYINRHCSVIFDRKSLEQLAVLPRYFIFFPYNDLPSNELFQFLKEKYTFLFQCESLRFPAVFCKLND